MRLCETMAISFFVDSSGEKPVLKLVGCTSTRTNSNTMDISRLVDFSGEKPVLKPGGWTFPSYPIVPPIKGNNWFDSTIVRYLTGRKGG